MGPRGWLCVLALAIAGCGARAYACQGDASCRDGDVMGRCEPDGGCSFPDASCPSGYRYGEHAGHGLAGECVADDPIAGTGTSTSDAGTTTLASTTTSSTAGDSTTAGIEATGDPTLDATDATSTKGPESSSDAESSGSPITTGSDDDPYGPCKDEMCIDAAQCSPLGALPLTCAPACDDDGGRPPPQGGSAVPVCIGEDAPSWCALACMTGDDCPPGMECTEWEAQTFGTLCTWF